MVGVDVTWTGGPSSFDGINAGYWRLSSVEKVRPPFVWSGTVTLHEVMNPPVFGYGWRKGQTATYQPKLNWHPLYPSNERNVVVGVGNVQGDPRAVGISAEMRDVRPERPYGPRTGYVSRYRTLLPSSPVDGQRHEFIWDVPSHARYRLLWDGQVVCDVVEKQPATIDRGLVSVGLRLDFCHVEFDEMRLEQGASVTTYPNGYGSTRITLKRMRELHEPRMHPEFARRFFAYIEHKQGLLGVGGGWRKIQPVKPGFAPPGMSFHEDQRFASGFVGYAAVDLVKGGTGDHVSPAWGDTDDAELFGLHTFITGEPWHIQCVEMRGWQTWVNAGRPDPKRISLPGDKPPLPPTIGGHSVFQKLIRLDGTPAVYAQYSGGYKTWIPTEAALAAFRNVSGKDVEVIPAAMSALFVATGHIQGPIPPGVDAWGLPQ